MLVNFHAFPSNCRKQGFLDSFARHVLDVKYSALAVAPFPSQRDSTVVQTCESDSELDEILDAGGTIAQDFAHDLLIAEPVTGLHGVGHVLLQVVSCRSNGSNSALGIIRIGLGLVLLGENRDAVSSLSYLQGKAEAGDSAADDDQVVFRFHGLSHKERD